MGIQVGTNVKSSTVHKDTGHGVPDSSVSWVTWPHAPCQYQHSYGHALHRWYLDNLEMCSRPAFSRKAGGPGVRSHVQYVTVRRVKIFIWIQRLHRRQLSTSGNSRLDKIMSVGDSQPQTWIHPHSLFVTYCMWLLIPGPPAFLVHTLKKLGVTWGQGYSMTSLQMPWVTDGSCTCQ